MPGMIFKNNNTAVFSALWKRACSRPLTAFVLQLLLLLLPVLLSSAAAAGRDDKMVEVILDASGSMNAKLRSGETRLGSVKKAVEELARQVDPATVIAVRAYGHQSAPDLHDCFDTKLLTTFGYARDVKEKLVLQSNGLKATGLSPVTYVLGEAARDFRADFGGDIIIVLVGDGRETCKGDPCVLARNLAKERDRLVIHTIGISADVMARQQFECIARATGGRSFFPEDAASLARALNTAVSTPRGMIIRKIGDGMLRIEGAESGGHSVTNAETGERLGTITQQQPAIRLSSGVYDVAFGAALWKSIEVEPGAVTLLRPAILRVEHAGSRGHKVIEAETGEEFGVVSRTKDTIALMPGDYGVLFGNAVWRVNANAGARLTLNPGLVSVKDATPHGHRIRTMRGELVDTISYSAPTVPLPPGEYTIELDDKMKPFTLKEGDHLFFQKK